MLEKLVVAAERGAQKAVDRHIDRFAASPAIADVQIDAVKNGILLSGKRLRRRWITDSKIRNSIR